MNLEIILAFIVGALIGGFATFKLLPGFLKSIFRDTARDELSEIQQEITDDQIQIGDIFAGGIVFQINENGSGLVAAIEDIGPYNWSEALSEASNYSLEGYTGWHLPSLEELELMYNTIGQGSPEGNIGGFAPDGYWSSSEKEDDNLGACGFNGNLTAWLFNFPNGLTYIFDKQITWRVRVIRSF